jgi:hypothetical protein
VNRVAATSYLTTEYQELTTEAKFTVNQTTVAYNAAIDMSLRQLGVQETDLPSADIPQAQVLSYIALLNYYALKRFQRVLSLRHDVKMGNGALDASRSQAFGAVSRLLETATEELLSLGISLQGVGFELGRINLDYNEPGPTGDLAGLDSFWWF